MDNRQTIDLIRSKVDIVDIIGERIALTKHGKNYFCVCPFHDDNNPSMSISREKQIYTCFSCHKTGNVFGFLMDYEHMDFSDVLNYLGKRVGIEVKTNKLEGINTSFKEDYDIYNLASMYYHNNLFSKEGNLARNYLQKRSISEQEIKEFQIGLALKNNSLTELLVLKKYKLEKLNKLGLTNIDKDLYVDRIMFPLWDINGKVVAFSGRIYKDTDLNISKYINTKETEIFKKGQILYHYHIAKEECRKSKYLLIMEGFMDIIRASSVGVKNTIALMGTALTKEHINLIKRLSSNIIICLDGDVAGEKATMSVGEELLKNDIEAKVIRLPKEDDPDTFILNNGKDKFLRLVDSAMFFSEYKLNTLKANVNFNSSLEKSEYINNALEQVSKLNDPIRIEIILKTLAKNFDIGYNTLEKRFRDISRKIPDTKKEIVVKSENVHKNKYTKAFEQIVYYLLVDNTMIEILENEKLVFAKSSWRSLINEICCYYDKYQQVTIADFYTYIQSKEQLLKQLNSILASNYDEAPTKEKINLYFDVMRENNLNLEVKRLKEKIKEELDPLEQAKYNEEIRKLRMGDE